MPLQYVDLWMFDERILWFSDRPFDANSYELIFTRSFITIWAYCNLRVDFKNDKIPILYIYEVSTKQAFSKEGYCWNWRSEVIYNCEINYCCPVKS